MTRAIDQQITYWAELCKKYPLNDGYKNTLASLQQQRADVANRIGRNNDTREKRFKRELGFPFKGNGR